MAKWSTFQVLIVANMILFMFMLERMVSSHTFQPPTAGVGVGAVNTGFSTILVYTIILLGLYLLFLFEAKKNRALFRHRAWLKMPQLTLLIALIAASIFILMATMGPLFNWVMQYRFLLYIVGVFFLFMTFLFVFSLIHKRRFHHPHVESSVHWSLVWTALVFMGTFFVFPSL
jgi:heme/copper-type cytochrome/quinol oxidase subunit 2